MKGKRQERKRRARHKGRARGPQTDGADVAAAPPRTGRVRPRMPRTMRASRQAVSTMSVADAVRAVDGNRDGIVVFLDPETASINVLSRRADGELTLVEIEL